MKKRFLSIILALCLTVSMTCVGIVPAAADTSDPTVETYAQNTVDGSVILHCFDWSYNNIKAALPDIAKAGYTAVQTSPVQAPKDYNASWTDGSGQWWKLYQPLGLRIADGNTWLGTKAELASLCTEAEKYNIKVIVDIVANHLANNGNSGGGYSNVNSGIDASLKNASYYHSANTGANDDNRYNITQYHIGMPDLNTGNSMVQQMTLALLEECIDCGVDGFRFDAAKHIETPADAQNFKSQFWPVVINGAKNYAEEKGVSEPFFYGEILGSAGPNFSISNYTQYMSVTDNYTGDRALDKAYYQAASELADSSYYKGAGASKSVLWVESHDTYMGNSGMAGFSNTSGINSDVITRAWAIVASRGDSASLFFARPNSRMGSQSSDTTWKSKAVAEINKFKNAFNGKSEYLASSGKVAYNERGTKGVVISKLDGGGSVTLDAHTIEDGVYTDHITGNTFTVSNKKITGTVGSTGVAVVYNTEDTTDPVITAPTLYLVPNTTWTKLHLRYAMYLFNSSGDSQWVDMTAVPNGAYAADVPAGTWNHVIFCGMRSTASLNEWANKVYQTNDLFPDSGMNCYTVTPDTKSYGGGTWSVYSSAPTEAPTVVPTIAPTSAPTDAPTDQPTTPPSGDTITVYAINNASWSKVNIHYWGGSSGSSWPGKSMTAISGTKVYQAEIPSGTTGVVLNDGNGKQTVNIENSGGFADGTVWKINSTQSSGKYTYDTASTYYLVGTINDWKKSDDYAFSICATDTGKVEYKLSKVTLPKDAEIKILSSSGTWYPGGSNYKVTDAGTYDVYFRPNGDGNSDWYESYFYLANVTPHTVTWKDGDGNVLKTDTVIHGKTPSYSGATPTKTEDDEYTYTFSGWDNEITAVTKDTTYTAQFTSTKKQYTISWFDGDGNLLGEDQVDYGDVPAYSGATPTKSSVDQYSYVFDGTWTPAVHAVTGDETYMANFSSTASKYTVTWKNFDGSVLETDADQELGAMPSYDGATPVKPSDAKYNYSFMGWSPAVSAVKGNATYTAEFASIIKTFTVSWVDDDDTVLEIDGNVAYGSTPTYDKEEPSKENTDKYIYTFTGWTPAVSAVSGNITYKATYSVVEMYTVKATNILNWDDVYLYYWTDDGDNSWPGTKMTPDDENLVCTVENIPSTAKGIVLNNGKSGDALRQTVNITSGIKDGAHWAILNEKDEEETSKYTIHAVHDYYLVGTMTNWKTDEAAQFVPHRSSDMTEEYKITSISLSKNDAIKVYGADNDKWYPDGSGSNYTVSADGSYNIYFRPNADGGDDWHENVFYVKNVTPYTVTWKNADGSILKTDENILYGTTPTYEGTTPEKAENTYYTYTFAGWTPRIAPVTGDAEYTAKFTATAKPLTVYVEDPAGGTITLDDVTGDTTAAQIKTILVTETGIPATEQRLIFADREIENTETLAEANVGNGSTLRLVIKTYTITWLNDNGATLATEPVAYGTTPVYSGETPTKEADAQYTYTFSGWDKDIVPVAEDAVYTATYTAAQRTFFSGYSLTLKGEIGVNFFIDLCGRSADNAEVTLSWYQYTETVRLSDLSPESSGLYKITCYVAAKEMTDAITAVLTIDDEAVATDTYSVAAYANRIIENEDGEFDHFKDLAQLQSLCKAMLHYGAQAQIYFDHNAEDPADSKIDYAPESIDDAKLILPALNDEDFAPFGLTYVGDSLLLKNTTTLRVFFTPDENYDGTEVYFGDQKLTAGTRGSMIYFDIKGIKAADILKNQTLVFKKSGVEDKEIAFNVSNYIAGMENDLSLNPLLTGLYDYNRKAVAYFG